MRSTESKKQQERSSQKMHQATAAGGSAINTSLFIQELSNEKIETLFQNLEVSKLNSLFTVVFDHVKF